jgi:hypothetical protein
MLSSDSLKTTFDAREGIISLEGSQRCEALLQEWMQALNRHDAVGMDAVIRFPHVRAAANQVFIYEAPCSNPMDLFTKLVDLQGWHHSAWTEVELLQSSPIKAHYAVQYRRYRVDGSIIGIYDSLYVFTEVDGDWKLQFRSSFGP